MAKFIARFLIACSFLQFPTLICYLDQTTGSIGIYMNITKIELLCFKQEEAISTLSGKTIKLRDKFTCLSSNISSTESDDNIHLAKVWTATDKLLIKWKSDFFERIK